MIIKRCYATEDSIAAFCSVVFFFFSMGRGSYLFFFKTVGVDKIKADDYLCM